MRDTARTTSIQRLGYLPKAAAYRFDIEAFTMADLRLRGSEEKVRTTHRYEFHMLVCVTRGACTQMVDFRPVQCAPGSLLMLKPGQAHNFGRDEDWEGWIVLFRPDHRDYTAKSRKLFDDKLATLPGPVAADAPALLSLLAKKDFGGAAHAGARRTLRDTLYDHHDGRAGERLADLLLDELDRAGAA